MGGAIPVKIVDCEGMRCQGDKLFCSGCGFHLGLAAVVNQRGFLQEFDDMGMIAGDGKLVPLEWYRGVTRFIHHV